MSSAKWRPFCLRLDVLTMRHVYCITEIEYATLTCVYRHHPDSKVHGAYMGPTWGRQDPGGPHVGPMIFAIWAYIHASPGSN